MDTVNLAEIYHLPPIEWSAVRARLAAGIEQGPGSVGPGRHTCWLTTIDADGAPHVTGVGAVYAEDCFWFTTGATSRKGRNLARDPRCALAVATIEFDLTVEGRAALITDPAVVAARVAQYVAQGWPARVDESGHRVTADYSAPSAGRPPWSIYRIEATAATALRVIEPNGATRWRF